MWKARAASRPAISVPSRPALGHHASANSDGQSLPRGEPATCSIAVGDARIPAKQHSNGGPCFEPTARTCSHAARSFDFTSHMALALPHLWLMTFRKAILPFGTILLLLHLSPLLSH